MKKILVDEDRYDALEALFAVLRYESEAGDGFELRSVSQTMFELSKNTTVLGPSKDLIKQYEHLAETEYLFRCALAEIANMDGEAANKARQTLEEWHNKR